MDMKFSVRFMKVTFEEGELFAGLSVRMRGKPLSGAYYASLDTMEWIEDHQTYPVDDYVKQKIRALIEQDNLNHPYQVLFAEK